MTFRVVLIGATGVFGSRVARRLAGDARFELVVAGRHRSSLGDPRQALGDASVRVAELDVLGDDLLAQLGDLQPDLVVHAAGPFQWQDYRVAEACLACGSHYVDLADGRAFVAGIDVLDARSRGGQAGDQRRVERAGPERRGGRCAGIAFRPARRHRMRDQPGQSYAAR